MNAAGLVSIVINNYNYGHFLAEAIDSALAQDYPAVETIVVDDGSDDNSAPIIRSYGSRLAAVFKPNAGQGSAINAGFERARGEFVIFLDADDVLLPGAAGQVVAAFRHNPNAAKVQYRMAVIDGRGRRTGAIKPDPRLAPPQGDLRRQVTAFSDDIPWLPTSGNAFPSRVLGQILPMPEAEYPILADFYLSHLAALYGPVVMLDRVGACYRVHGGNNHEVAGADLHLEQVRRKVIYWQRTHGHLRQHAERLGLLPAGSQADELLSVSYVANRLISLRLEPEKHPFPEDRRARLVWLGLQAARRRFDAPASLRLAFGMWFVLMAGLPGRPARWLAEKFLYPERRGRADRLVDFFRRRRPQTGGGDRAERITEG